MARTSNERIVAILRELERRMGGLEEHVGEVKAEFIAVRGHVIAIQQDIANIYGVLARHETRFDDIERRLGLAGLE